MTKIVGDRERSEFIRDPQEAWRIGRKLDAMLSAALTPATRGVRRGSHAAFNAEDDERARAQARRLNQPLAPALSDE